MMHSINWSDLITEELLDRLRTLAGVPIGNDLSDIKPILVKVFVATGGLPIVEAEPDTRMKTSLGLQLLHQGAQHVLGSTPFMNQPVGIVFQESGTEPVRRIVIPIEKVPVNSAPIAALEDLPVIGPMLAQRIITERITHGPFVSFNDLAERVKGLGEGSEVELKYALRYDHPNDEWRFAAPREHDFDTVFVRLLQMVSHSDPMQRLRIVIDRIATSCSGDPHPASADMVVRDSVPAAVLESTRAEWAGVLAGSEYYTALPTLIARAQTNIDVCMFHIAFPSEEHPTRTLVNALVDAHKRGVQVRVLVDRDRKSDPYNSTIINLPAKHFFDENGIPCRFDEESKLLHSKYIVIDKAIVIIGSHNWSAGSFFQFDDISLGVGSLHFAEKLTARFDQLWEAAGGGSTPE